MLVSLSIAADAQQLYVETGKTISSFNYKNSAGKQLENLHSTNHVFMSLGYRKSIFTKNLFLNVSGNYNNYGAAGSDKELDNYFDWDLTYLGLGLGLDYYVYTTRKLGFYIKGALSGEFLIQGSQTLNSQVFDLRKEEDFDSPVYFLRAGLGAQYKASGNLSFFTQYMYGNGGLFKNEQGHLKMNDHRFGLGVLIEISKRPAGHLENNTPVPDDPKLDELKKEVESNAEKIKALEASSAELDALKKQLADRENEIRAFKEAIANALQPYRGSDLTITDVDGKIYVTMGNGMLFKSGSSKLSGDGIKAINDLGNVLAENTNVDILIEGHTDDRPFKNNNRNNWDLSVERATAVVEILTKNKNIDPKKLTAAGKGEQEPIADNGTKEGREKNRRIEIIISPQLDRLSELIRN